MKTRSYLMLLLSMLMLLSFANAQTVGSIWGYGLEGGFARGDNAGKDESFVPMGRGHLQLQMSRQLMVRFGVSYAQLEAVAENDATIYETKTLQGDIRILFRPVQINLFSPYVYAGFGGVKDMAENKADILPVVPAGFGFQTRLSSRFLFDLSTGYNLALSDKLDDERVRTDDQLNRFTNKKHDGYYNVMLGIVLTRPYERKEKIEKTIDTATALEIDPKTLDSDNDGLSDAMETTQYKTDPYKADTDGDGLSDGDEIQRYRTDPLLADTDGDDLSDYLEITKYKTDPNKADTDGDGLSDGDEVLKYRTDPLNPDSDGDGLKDGAEINLHKTDPLKADTDNDGLNDYAEVNTYRTNPLNIDSDGGSMNDGAEIQAGKNPLDPKDDVQEIPEPKQPEAPIVPTPKPDTSKKDTDGDGLTDVDEINIYRTDVNKKDTDGDGLSDGEEVLRYRTDPLAADTDKDGLSDGLEVNQYKTDPNKADTDGDGLSDYAELMTHRTDPLKIDTDGGGMNDGAEIKAGKNPLDPKDDLLDMSKGKKVVLEGIVFASGQATILPESTRILDKVYESLNANPDVNVQILGHTDSVGSDENNRSLSLRRAQAVKDWLTAKGINASRIKVVGKGEAEPIASNDTAAGRAQNRRIEFMVEN